MNLLLLDQFSDLGGAQQGLLELLPSIRERGWRALLGIPGNGSLFDHVRSLGFAAESIDCGPYSSGRKSLADIARFVGSAPTLARQIRRLASAIGADLVYVNGPRLVPAAALARLRMPVLFHAHSYIAPGAVRRITGAALRIARARVVGSCEFVTDPWRPYVARGRASVIYNGVPGPPQYPPSTSARRAPVVGCIGRIAPEKGQLEFLQAAALIHAAIPECRFVIYGAPLFDDPGVLRYDQAVRAAAAGLPVTFFGWIHEVYPELAGLDLLLVPSAGHEATTRVILEAFAAGVPVIAFRSGGIPEVVDDGLDGYLVSDAPQMASKAIDLLTGRVDRAALSDAARRTWSRRFTKEHYHCQLLEAMQRAAL